MKSPPKVSLLILNYNGRNITPMILDSVKLLKYPLQKLEVIVIDNASTDGSADFLKKQYSFIKLLQLKKNIGYGAMNFGIKSCTGEYCFLLNNDMELHPDCISELVRALELEPEAVIAAPALYDLKTKRLLYTRKSVSRAFYTGSDYYDAGKERRDALAAEDTYTGVPFLRASFAKSQPYIIDPDYFLCGDDIDLGYRLRVQGHKIPRVRRAILYHEGSVTVKSLFKNAALTYHNEKNGAQTYLKNLEANNLLLWLPYFALFRMANLAKSIITFDVRNALALFRAWRWVLANLGKIKRKRREVQLRRRSTDKQVFAAIGGERAVIRYLFANAPRSRKPQGNTALQRTNA